MKNTPLSILACVCLILSAFLCGLYIGRGMSGSDVSTEVLFSQPTVTDTPTDPTEPSVSAEATDPTVPGKININTADLETLMKLDGIGEVYAQRIIDFRTQYGPFETIYDILDVPGIGEKRFEAIMNDITV